MSFTTANTTPVGTTPVHNSTIYNAMPTVTGVAADAGSGVAKVLLRLYRPKTGGGLEYWNGTSWGALVYLTTTLNPAGGGANVSWSYSNVPTGANLADGTYYLAATAYDRVNKVAAASTSFKKVEDTVAPTVNFTTSATTPVGTTPITRSTISGNIPTITGQAADAGSGVAKVLLRLYRPKTGGGLEYWNGSTWSSSVYLTTTLNPAGGGANVSWSYSNVPSGANLADGTYYLAVTAYDRVNKVVAASSSFTRASAGGGNSTQPVVSLSTVQAWSVSQSVKLTFTEALSSTSATQITNYSLSVNGIPVGVQKASYNGTTLAVTLQLAAGTLGIGDTVLINWNLRDSWGRTVSGQAGLKAE